MKIPQNLKHHAVLVLEDYNLIDGPYAGPDTDAQGLSLGLAQWNERGNVDISAKVWRHTGERWSRQSEELPLHRVLDLTLLICEAQKHIKKTNCSVKPKELEASVFGTINLQDKSLPVVINSENQQIGEDLELFKKCLDEDQEWIIPRLTLLAQALKDLGILP